MLKTLIESADMLTARVGAYDRRKDDRPSEETKEKIRERMVQR